MAKKPRILVTYGCHLKEKYAETVGEKFRDTYLQSLFPDVVIARWKGIRGTNRLAQMRQDIRARYAIDLHDDSLAYGRLMRIYEEHPECWQADLLEKFHLTAHLEMDYKDASNLMHRFRNLWNRERPRECWAEACDRDYCSHRGEYDVMYLEFRTVLPIEKPKVEEGIEFLKELIDYLQSEG